jgi:hypothetical protein
LSDRVIFFVFGGRKPNMELQLPFVRRILELNPQVEYHIWDLARDEADSKYLRRIKGDRITVCTDFAGENPWQRFTDVYRHYAQPEYAGCLFVKGDDDVVFIEATRFTDFITAVDENRDAFVSANVVNNGACIPTTGCSEWFKAMRPRLALLDVHMSAKYAEMAHTHFHDNWTQLVDQPIKLVPTEDWVSINLIGFDHRMAVKFAELLETPPPRVIAGRHYNPRKHKLGDEGMVNMFPRLIMQGFTAAHLSFGPQEKRLTEDQLALFRKRYAEISRQYL